MVDLLSVISVNNCTLHLCWFRDQAIDVWTGVCLTFVFSALLEFALVNYASRADVHLEKHKKQRRQWELERERERQAATEVASASSSIVLAENRLEDGMSTFSYMVIVIVVVSSVPSF